MSTEVTNGGEGTLNRFKLLLNGQETLKQQHMNQSYAWSNYQSTTDYILAPSTEPR